jgi:acetyl esterase/lipase
MTALVARNHGLPQPAGLVAMSPVTDFDVNARLHAPSARTCGLFPASFIPPFMAVLRGRDGGITVAPCEENVAGLPPVLIQASTSEIFYPDAVKMAQNLANKHVPVKLETWDRQLHVFQAAASIVPESRAAVDSVIQFINECTRPAGACSSTLDDTAGTTIRPA